MGLYFVSPQQYTAGMLTAALSPPSAHPSLSCVWRPPRLSANTRWIFKKSNIFSRNTDVFGWRDLLGIYKPSSTQFVCLLHSATVGVNLSAGLNMVGIILLSRLSKHCVVFCKYLLQRVRNLLVPSADVGYNDDLLNRKYLENTTAVGSLNSRTYKLQNKCLLAWLLFSGHL